MKLAGRDLVRFLTKPDASLAGALFYGADPIRVGAKRAALVEAIIGPEGPAEMRLTRMAGADLRRDPAALDDAVKAVGFFPGPRVVLIEEAGDGQAPVIASALAGWRAGDARIVVTAGALGAASALRKGFEKATNAAAIAIYSDPPGREEIEAELARVGLTRIGPEAMADLETLGRGLESGDFSQFLIRLALYKLNDPTPLSSDEIAACAPQAQEADVDEVLHLVAEGRARDLRKQMQRMAGQGGNPTSLTIAAVRHFRALHAAASAPDGPDAALARARPPVFGPRRSRMASQARGLGTARLEKALGWIMDTDLRLRSSRPTPGMAMVERLFVRIATLPRD